MSLLFLLPMEGGRQHPHLFVITGLRGPVPIRPVPGGGC